MALDIISVSSDNRSMTNDNYRIYVASLSDYNAGRHHGAWIDVDEWMDADDLQEKINAILKTSPEAAETGWPAEEWAIHDMEGFPSNMGENTPIQDILKFVEYAEDQDEGDVFLAYQNYSTDFGDWESAKDSYYGVYDTMRELAESQIGDQLDACPETIQDHFDWESYEKSLDNEFNILYHEGQYYVFGY